MKESIKSVKSEIKKSAEEIACALAPMFIMTEIRFLSQYTAVSRGKTPYNLNSTKLLLFASQCFGCLISFSLSYIRATIWVKIRANHMFGFVHNTNNLEKTICKHSNVPLCADLTRLSENFLYQKRGVMY